MREIGEWGLRSLPSGVPGLDQVLGGGIPEFSFNLIAGTPGTGKTTLAHQILFANASPERPGLHFTILGEPPLKMLRYQRQFAFFDPKKVDRVVRYRDLGQEVTGGDMEAVLKAIVTEVEESNPKIVVIDSFRTLPRSLPGRGAGEMAFQHFLQRLALYLGGWEATSFIIGDYSSGDFPDHPIFTVADGILWMSQAVDHNSVVRKLQVIKLRGQAIVPSLHTYRITNRGVRVFPRTEPKVERRQPRVTGRLATGVEGLDAMLGGGIPAGDSVVVAGPAGSGKTILSAQFVAKGVRRGETGVIAVFVERPETYLSHAAGLGTDLQRMVDEGAVRIIYLRPLDLSVDETLHEILEAVQVLDASRVVIDSISGFEVALARSFRQEFGESLYRMVSALIGVGATVLMTIEAAEEHTILRFEPRPISLLADDLIVQRYVELNGQLRRVMAVVKMRGSDHSKDFRSYEITSDGLIVGEVLNDYVGILTGVPVPRDQLS